MNFAEALKTIREARKGTQEQLAIESGVDIYSIQDLEEGILKPDKEIVAALCQALDVQPQVLLFFALEEKDIAPEKQQVYKQLQGTMKALILDIVKAETNH